MGGKRYKRKRAQGRSRCVMTAQWWEWLQNKEPHRATLRERSRWADGLGSGHVVRQSDRQPDSQTDTHEQAQQDVVERAR